MAKTHRIPQEHGRTAFMSGRCKCDEICRKATREYSRAYDRAKGVKQKTSSFWTEEELEIMRTSTLNNRELVALLPNRTYDAIARKRTLIGAGLVQRGLPGTRRFGPAKDKAPRPVKTTNPLPELVRNNRVKNKSTGHVYRITGVHLDVDQPYVFLDRVDTMFSKLLKTPIERLEKKYEGLS